jgi:hypothetical protein
MQRRKFLKTGTAIGAAGVWPFNYSKANPVENETANPRDYWVNMLTKISLPVLTSLSQGQLKTQMPVEAKADALPGRKQVTYLEALGRTLAGLAPWLELGPDSSAEGQLRKKYIALATASIKNAVNPNSPDFMNFTQQGQPLVDAAFLSHALLRAPRQLWGNLDTTTQQQLVTALQNTRNITPPQNNWLLFEAMVETALLQFTGNYNAAPINYALAKHETWYKGDGVYGDGAEFAFDYYNSFVIQPMLLDISATLQQTNPTYKESLALYTKRAQRYAEIMERLISPEGTFPPVGRSIAYRCGAFQLLAQLALQHLLPASLPPPQIRCALTALIKRSMESPGTFDENGWLSIGFCGHQPDIGESYISTGSLYLCSVAFLPLGLPATDDFWSKPFTEWTSLKAYSGKSFGIDHALKS